MHNRKERGQAMIEFAIILPVFFLLIFGSIDIYLAVIAKGSLNYVAEETAVCVSRNPTACPDPQAYAAQIGGGLGLSGAALQITKTSSSPKSNTITAVYTYSPITKFIPFKFTMTSVATATE